jgi:hypothetical protein
MFILSTISSAIDLKHVSKTLVDLRGVSKYGIGVVGLLNLAASPIDGAFHVVRFSLVQFMSDGLLASSVPRSAAEVFDAYHLPSYTGATSSTPRIIGS